MSENATQKSGPLSGIRVLDAASFLAGPTSATLLSEYGAEVIKIEQPSGDRFRSIAPFRGDVSMWWKVVARNRKSLTLDLKQSEAQEVFRQLASHCDVVVFNARPDTLKQWGLEYADLVKCRKDVVYFHLTAFGAGPYAKRPGIARVAEAYAGLTNRTGFPGEPPVQSGYDTMVDSITGIHGAFAIMLALRQRDRTGEPQMVDLGLYEPILSMQEDLIVKYTETGSRVERQGNSSPRWAPHGMFLTKDGLFIVLACSTEKLWQKLRKVIGDESLTGYDNNPAMRLAQRTELDARVSQWTKSYDQAELFEICAEAELACGPIYSPAEIVKDPHIVGRGSIISIDDAETGKPVRMASPAGRYSGFKAEIRNLGPGLGEHTEEILRDMLGQSPEQITALRAKKVIR